MVMVIETLKTIKKIVYTGGWRNTMFLDNVDITNVRASVAKREMSNWVKISERIYSTEDESMLLIMLKVELTSRNREYIVSRLYSRFSAVRAKREKEELKAWQESKDI